MVEIDEGVGLKMLMIEGEDGTETEIEVRILK
jgi:hypothetical protein